MLTKYRILRKMRWAGSVHRKDEKRITCGQIILWKHHLNDLSRLEDDSMMDLKEIGCKTVNWNFIVQF